MYLRRVGAKLAAAQLWVQTGAQLWVLIAQIQPTGCTVCTAHWEVCATCGEDQRRHPRIDPQAVANTWLPFASEEESKLIILNLTFDSILKMDANLADIPHL